jgi:hypothetical protein
MHKANVLLYIALLAALAASASYSKESPMTSAQARTRLIVMTDISTLSAKSGEPDDTQSLVRLLLYSNDLDIEGLIATHTRHNVVNPDYIRAIVRRYEKVRDNLLLHDSRYPTAECLLACVKAGYRERDPIGPGKDSDGSRWIIAVVDRPDPRPVWITIWGGSRELAQALWRVEQERGREGLAAFMRKLRVYSIGDQDTTGPWIREHHPDLFYITGRLSFRGLYRGGDPALVTREWVETNITEGHGPLGAGYPNYDGGDPWGMVKGIKEGDTPSFLYLIPNGLGDPERPELGSWGGRFEGGPHYFEAKDRSGRSTDPRATVFRWRSAYQADFQARMDWCAKPYDRANHAPVAVLACPPEMKVSPGTAVKLSAKGSSDPDGNRLSYKWSVYREAGSYRGRLKIDGATNQDAGLIAPEVDSPKTIHIILSVTDDGDPPLTRYRRVIVTVKPKT